MDRPNGIRSRKSFLAALWVMTGVPLAAQAAPITWHLVDVTYDDGGTASGSFAYDASLNLYSAISITTTAGSSFAGASYFDQLPRWTSNASQAYFTLSAPDLKDFDAAARFRFVSPLTDVGGTIDLLLSPIDEFPYHSAEGWIILNLGSPVGTLAWQRRPVSGRITSEPAAVPEPGTLALLGAGLGVATILRRRRTGMTVAA